MSSWYPNPSHIPQGGARHPPRPRAEGPFQRGHNETQNDWTQFYEADGQSTSQNYWRGPGPVNFAGPPQFDEGRRGHSGGHAWTDAQQMEGWGYADRNRSENPRNRHHCKCCPNHPRNLAMRGMQEMETMDLPEVAEPINDYEEGGFSNFRAGRGTFNGGGRHQRRPFHHRGGKSRGNVLQHVSHSNIGGQRYWSGGHSGKGFMGGTIPPEVKNQLKMAKDGEKRSYWQQLQQNLKRGEQGWRDALDLKSESAVGLSLDQIISQADPSRRSANQ